MTKIDKFTDKWVIPMTFLVMFALLIALCGWLLLALLSGSVDCG